MTLNEERERKIANVLETYFSDASLLWDKVVVSKILADPENMIPLETLCKLPKFKSINTLPEEIKNSAEKYSLTKLKFNETQDKIGRIKPYIVNKKEELDEWSVYVEGLEKPYNTEQKIVELFNKLVGHVSFFRIPPNQHCDTKFFGFCFIEFDNKENVQKAVDILNRYNTTTINNDENTKLADKLNLRVMTKLDWMKYRDEYLELMETKKKDIKKLWDDFYAEYPDGHYEQIDNSKPYNEGIIVFVDGLHLQCAKTTAIKLLETSGVKIDFMNVKKKGLSTTHIRLNNPNDAKEICNYFTLHPTIQETGQDTTGKEQETHTVGCLKLRVIHGKEEEIYWENEL